jgi:hypothetical protein
MPERCAFCGVGEGHIPKDAFLASRQALHTFGALRFLEGWVLMESEDYYAVPDALPVGSGHHILIVPKDHNYSYIQRQRAEMSSGESLASFTYQLGQLLFGGKCVFYEHGGFAPGSNARSVYHAHGHMIGTEVAVLEPLYEQMRAEGYSPTWLSLPDENYPKKIRHYVNGHGYLLVKQGNMGLLVDEGFGLNPTMKSQFGQRNLHALTKRDRNPYWDWKRIYCHSDTMRVAVGRTAEIIDLAQHKGLI